MSTECKFNKNKYVKAKIICTRVLHLDADQPTLLDIETLSELDAITVNKTLAIARKEYELGLLTNYLDYDFKR